MTDGTDRFLVIEGHEEGVNKLLTKAITDHAVLYMKVASKHTLPNHFNDDNLTLLQRSWVYQEQLLFRRGLHFGSIDLIWECNGTRSCSCGYARTASGGRHHRNHSVKPQHAVFLRSNISGDQMAARWANITEEYTAMNLTYELDRLADIAGVAKQIRRGLRNKIYG
jgi:hypothetical protein